MSNAFKRLLDLIPKEPESVGTVQSAEYPNYKVLVIDGFGLVACTASTVFQMGSRVFVRGQLIVRGAPAGEVMNIEV
ncbi:hypothetical protein [Acinetobacter kanungonis]|uniref:hypothetical protein n=1 Tax=Acinetobacter kanungonis TaxID=2699469 RepID=UPI0013795E27|nr:hypothetical protein [Acinetobacter kanungonis]NCI79745.1 hypothetical protein [Acinetobacter kanungonis]